MTRRAELALIAVANLLPLAGIVFLGWSVAEPVIIYCLEAVLIAMFDIGRIAANTANRKTSGRWGALSEKIIYIPLFIAIHLVPVLAVNVWVAFSFYGPGHDAPTFLMGDPGDYLRVAGAMREGLDLWAVGLVLLGLLFAEARSYRRNYVHGGAHTEALELRVFIYPLGRLLFLLLLVVPGAFALYYRASDWWYAVLLVFVKTAGDLARRRGEA